MQNELQMPERLYFPKLITVIVRKVGTSKINYSGKAALPTLNYHTF